MRKAKPKKRIILPDPIFNEVMVSRFVNHLMYDGKKTIAYDIFYTALENVKSKLPNEDKTPLEIWKKALENITPQVEVKSRRVGGATFQVPTEIRPERKESISMKNLIIFSRKRSGHSMRAFFVSLKHLYFKKILAYHFEIKTFVLLYSHEKFRINIKGSIS